jgi:hypothetical protein
MPVLRHNALKLLNLEHDSTIRRFRLITSCSGLGSVADKKSSSTCRLNAALVRPVGVAAWLKDIVQPPAH